MKKLKLSLKLYVDALQDQILDYLLYSAHLKMIAQ